MSDSAARILVEACAGSVADIERAMAAGADRVELCSALELGGLTPSIGLVETAMAASPIPVVVMLRPRAGGFRYDRHEFAAMLRDAERFLELGASGVVFGTLNEHGQIDVARCGELLRSAGAVQTIFHRAFDFVPDQRAALDTLIELGISRVLTNGGKPTAAEGAAAIRELISHAAGRIEVMPAGGINADNVLEIVLATGCNQVHVGASTSQVDGSIPDTRGIELVDGRFMQGVAHRAVSCESIAETVTALRSASPPR
jgi:copper homeostasis protein